MDATLMNLLKSVDTPTVCNAIEVAQGKRGFSDFTRGTPIATDTSAIVGYARTARIAGAVASTEAAETVRTRRMAYYRYMAEAPRPSIAVIEDLDFPDCVSAFWGEINTTIHKGFGLSGALTNGVVRDLGDLPEGFPVIAGSVGPSHAFVHVREFGHPVEVFGITVRPGDLVHADRHGAVVIPSNVVDGLAGAIAKLIDTEKIVLEVARRDDFTFERFEEAWARFEKART